MKVVVQFFVLLVVLMVVALTRSQSLGRMDDSVSWDDRDSDSSRGLIPGERFHADRRAGTTRNIPRLLKAWKAEGHLDKRQGRQDCWCTTDLFCLLCRKRRDVRSTESKDGFNVLGV